MSKQKTMQELFDLIHRGQAEKMLEALDGEDISPQMLSAINKFLADNGVSGVKGENKAISSLSAGLAAYEEGGSDVIFPTRQ
jgi:hypothetical protein